MSEIKRNLKIDLLIGLGVTIGLLLSAEMGLRLYWKIKWPQDLEWWKADGQAGAKYKPGTYGLQSPIGFSGQVNSLGYRGPEWTRGKGRRTYRMICVGDSVVLGLCAKQPESDFPTQLENLLNRNHQGKKIEVLNAGLGGNNSSQTLYRLKTELAELQPDCVIISVGLNDLIELNPGLPATYRTGGLARNLTKRSYLVRTFFGVVYKVLLPKLPHTPEELERKKRVFDQFVPHLYISNLTEMARICRERNVQIVFATLPHIVYMRDMDRYFGKVSLPYYARDIHLYRLLVDRYNESIHQVGTRENVPVAEMADFFKSLPNGSEFLVDNCHFTDAGYHLYAQALEKELRDKGVITFHGNN
ncbi:MAG: SGNH/GDSL hydrolase family protein [Elusimicrobia bacterium]|nr:SGNH/GDSL hydrolase family protein [Elusimicrobiota bacterium]